MVVDNLKEARTTAEAAVADMPAGELRTAAFSVILAHLLSDGTAGGGNKTNRKPSKPSSGQAFLSPKRAANGGTTGLGHRLLGLQQDGFFANQRSLSEVREELKKHGWHYPLTSLSGPMQKQVQERELRREQISEGKGTKKVWKYSNR